MKEQETVFDFFKIKKSSTLEIKKQKTNKNNAKYLEIGLILFLISFMGFMFIKGVEGILQVKNESLLEKQNQNIKYDPMENLKLKS